MAHHLSLQCRKAHEKSQSPFQYAENECRLLITLVSNGSGKVRRSSQSALHNMQSQPLGVSNRY